MCENCSTCTGWKNECDTLKTMTKMNDVLGNIAKIRNINSSCRTITFQEEVTLRHILTNSKHLQGEHTDENMLMKVQQLAVVCNFLHGINIDDKEPPESRVWFNIFLLWCQLKLSAMTRYNSFSTAFRPSRHSLLVSWSTFWVPDVRSYRQCHN